MMSRSVWHKLRESKFVSLEGLQWPEVLQGLQLANQYRAECLGYDKTAAS